MNHLMCRISGIQNKEHKTQLKNALDKIEGVGKVDVDLSAGTIEIKYNQPASENSIKDCIWESGFKIIGG
ncbi:heavy-metal-associated domain-containing protein [Papillibacter cinnamivorans]|uniref:Copper chaperone CopZ n=1 Tax=Papillibacter cinnamivorans DSM 12816 TaxID=1122930 RepID=A0A1W1ZS08_9FIRM|nr:heavy metal-associated domain-containing protein [Papillibacter cinnamivorans]SMC50858.1 Copper chaperone CopZ [Papillibacter cinnamivorans DSM 12816]